jgi:hypothetical protein
MANVPGRFDGQVAVVPAAPAAGASHRRRRGARRRGRQVTSNEANGAAARIGPTAKNGIDPFECRRSADSRFHLP